MRQLHLSPPARLADHLDHWVETGVITAEQAQRTRADLAGPAALDRRQRHGALAIEALGYLGSVLIVVATVLLASQYWRDLSVGGHLAVVGAAAVALFGCGLAVPARLGAPGTRLHAVLWTATTAAT